MTKTYRLSLAERLTNLTLALLFATVATLMALFSGPYWSGFGGGAFGVFLAIAGFFTVRWVSSFETIDWAEAEAGVSVTRRRWGRRRSVWLEELTEVRVIPCDMQTRLRTADTRLVLSHKLLRFEDLLERLRLARPDLFALPGDTLRLRATHIGVISLLLFAAGTALAGTLLATWQAWLGPVFWTVAGIPLVRIVFFFPMEYRIVPGSLTIHYLARRHVLESRLLQRLRQDTYAAGGGVFFLIRLEFPGTAVVLDEGHLRDPLRPVADWLSVALI